MNIKTNLIRSTLVAAAILGCALTAMAQGGMGAGKVVVHDFPIVSLKPANLELGFKAETVEVALLLPAIQKVREAAARIHLEGEGWETSIPVYGRTDGTKMAKIVFWTSEAINPNGGTVKVLNIQDQMGEIRQLTIPSVEIAISILLPVGGPKKIIANSITHNKIGEIVLADGSVRPILIGMLLPAIQKVRVD